MEKTRRNDYQLHWKGFHPKIFSQDIFHSKNSHMLEQHPKGRSRIPSLGIFKVHLDRMLDSDLNSISQERLNYVFRFLLSWDIT